MVPRLRYVRVLERRLSSVGIVPEMEVSKYRAVKRVRELIAVGSVPFTVTTVPL